MAWPDLRRQVFAYILNRLRLFTNVNPDQLEISFWTTSQVKLKDLEVDTDRLNVPGVSVRSATIKNARIELSSSGVRLDADDVYVVAAVHQVESDLAFSTFLEQTTADLTNSIYESTSMPPEDPNDPILADEGLTGYGGGDMTGMVARMADIALAQLKINISSLTIKCIIGDQFNLICHIETVISDKNRLQIKHVKVTTDSLSPALETNDQQQEIHESDEQLEENIYSRRSKSADMTKSVRFVDVNSPDASQSLVDEDDDLSKSVYYDTNSHDSDESSDEGERNSAMMQSSYFSREQVSQVLSQTLESKPAVVNSVLWISDITLSYVLHDRKAHVDIGTIRVNMYPTLSAAVECFNILFKMPPSGVSDDSEPFETSLAIHKVSLALCELDEKGEYTENVRETTLGNIKFASNHLILETVEAEGVQVATPFLKMNVADIVNVKIQNPISISANNDDILHFTEFLSEVVSIFSALVTPDATTQALINVKLPEIKIQFGKISIFIFPGVLTETRFEVPELLVNCGTDRVLVRQIVLDGTAKDTADATVSVDSIDAMLDTDLFDAVTELASIISDSYAPSIKPRAVHPSQNRGSQLSLVITKTTVRTPLFTLSCDLNSSIGEVIQIKSEQKIELGDHQVDYKLTATKTDMLSIDITDFNSNYIVNGVFPKRHAENSGVKAKIERNAQDISFYSPIIIELKLSGCLLSHGDDVIKALFQAEATLHEDQLLVSVPDLSLWILDETPIELGSIRASKLKGTISSMNFDASIDTMSFSSCADSLYALMHHISSLSSEKKQETYDIELDQSTDVFGDIDEEAFSSSSRKLPETLDMLEDDLPGNLKFMESYYQTTSGGLDSKDAKASQLLELNLAELGQSRLGSSSQMTSLDQSLYFDDEYLKRLKDDLKKSDSSPLKNSFNVAILKFAWNIHDGYDLAATREQLNAAVARVEEEAAKLDGSDLEDGETPLLGDFMYNSVFIGAKAGAAGSQQDLRHEIDETLGSHAMKRSAKPKLILKAVNSRFSGQNYNTDVVGDVINSLVVDIDTLIIKDKIPTSSWDVFFGHQSGRSQREEGKSMFHLRWDTIVSHTPEVRASFSCLPLRFYIDQDTLDFAIRFFSFQGGNNENPETENEHSTPPPRENLAPFFQRFEVFDIPIIIDYKPKKVDYAGIRSGHFGEFINLFALERSSVVLRHVIVRGVSGMGNFWKSVSNAWAPDIRDNQLADIVLGLGPIRSIAKIGGSLRSLVVMPLQEYKRDGEGLAGFRRGTLVLTRTTAMQLLKLGARFAKGSQEWLESAEKILGGGGAVENTTTNTP